MISSINIRTVVLLLMMLRGISMFSQNKLDTDSFPKIATDLVNSVIKWETFYSKIDKKYYFTNDSNQLVDGIVRYKIDPIYYTREYYKLGVLLRVENIYPNGQIHSILLYQNNKIKDGIYTSYYNTGERKEIQTYLHGNLNGASISFYRSGKISVVSNYKNGKYDGEIISFYENGSIYSDIMVKDGEKEGLSILYYKNGQKASEGYLISTFRLGNGCSKTWYRNGKLGWKVCYNKNGKRNGLEQAYDEWGGLKYQKKWDNGKVILRKKFGSLDNLWLPNIVEGHRIKMKYYFDKDDW